VKRSDKTTMGGRAEGFTTTHWSVILELQEGGDEARRQAALNELLGRYWKPVYCYLRRKGCGNEEAKDLTQGFFMEVVLGRGLVEQADQAKGRFRTFLLTALDRYATSVHRAATAKKRMPEGGLAPLDAVDGTRLPEPADDATPEGAFHYAWACELLDEVLAEVASGCRERGMAVHWAVFRARVLRPILDDERPVPLRELCSEHGIESEARASNMLVTVKRRFQAALRARVRLLVVSDADVDAEIGELMAILSASRAGP